MNTYYVSPSGSDSNNGLGPDPTNATNKPFLTLGKALAAGGVATPGDTVYLSPGVYRHPSAFIVGVNGASGSPITVAGDPGNALGFKDGSGNLISAGEVRVTNYSIDDKTLPTFNKTLDLSGKAYFNFSNIWFIGGTSLGTAVYLTSGAHDITFTRCMFQSAITANSGQTLVPLANSTSQYAMNISFDRCVFLPLGSLATLVTLSRHASADYDAGVLFQNCLFMGGSAYLKANSTGSGSFSGGGVTVRNCTCFMGASNAIAVTDANFSTTYPFTVSNSIITTVGATAINAVTAGQIVEDYNYISGGRTNVTAGARSISDGSHCLMLDFGQWNLWGQTPRPFLTPTVGSPQLGFGNAAGAPSIDFLGRQRPEGGGSLSKGIGYLERHDTAVQENAVTDSDGAGIRLDGPASHEFQIPVDTTSTTISVKCNYDFGHGTATPPQAILAASPELGVASQTVTAPAAVGQWSTLGFAPFTPTARGVVRVILASRPTAANGKAYFDTFAVS